MVSLRSECGVSLIQNTNLLFDTQYFFAPVSATSAERKRWFAELYQQAQACELVFLDPDNGLEVKSRPYGRKLSEKYVYWREVEALWRGGKSLLLFQYFARENRAAFIQRKSQALAEAAPGAEVEAFCTAHVLFLLALQPGHQAFRQPIIRQVQEGWEGQIRYAGEVGLGLM